MAISGNTAIVSAPNQIDANTGNRGVASIFVKNAGVWNWQASIDQPDGGFITLDTTYWCTSVAIDGDTAIIGDATKQSSQGVAYIYHRVGTSWSLQQTLSDPKGTSHELFGCAVALAGDVAIVGAPGLDGFAGGGFAFARSGASWALQSKLTSSDRAAADYLGTSVAVSSTTAVIGAPGSLANTGAAYVFARAGSTWAQVSKLTASVGAIGDNFGAPVSISGGTIAIGAPGKRAHTGSVYLFTHPDASWKQRQELYPSVADGAFFGNSVALDGDRLVIGERLNSAAYMFERGNAIWTSHATFAGNDGSVLGNAVAISRSEVIIGAVQDGVGGRAYIFQDDQIFADSFQ